MKPKNLTTYIAIPLLILGFTTIKLDDQLQHLIQEKNIVAPEAIPNQDPVKVELGRLLFFDKLLSGNKDVSCATCHHPALASADAIALPIGVGGKGLGKERIMGEDRERVPRNSPDVFNRGAKEWHTMFWDSRVSGSPEEGFVSPADEKLPEGLENLLAVQAMFPVTSRDEMRGEAGDRDVFGEPNEIALISPASEHIIWHRLMMRILEYPKYRRLFKVVYPDIALEDLGFQHAANAIAAFEMAAFTLNDSPWDQYLAGNSKALNKAQKRGAVLFYGKANCSTCHTGPLLTDQQSHNIGVPQIGPGKGNARPIDVGRYAETGKKEDLFAFRTPPLKNVALTGPWMHNGAYQSLEEVIAHHLNPEKHLQQFDTSDLPEELQPTFADENQLIRRLIKNIDDQLKPEQDLSKGEMKDLLSFLHALTDEGAAEIARIIPRRVPSGLPVID